MMGYIYICFIFYFSVYDDDELSAVTEVGLSLLA